MFNSPINIIIFTVFIVSGILIGYGLTFSEQFNHTDSISHQKKINWWKVCIVATCCALILSLSAFAFYKIYHEDVICNKGSENPWINEWDPNEQQSHPPNTVKYTRDYTYPVKYPGIPLMEPNGMV